jgi:hypothetical protein
MANYKLILGHVLKFEGGCSSDPRDNALKLGNSGVLGKDAVEQSVLRPALLRALRPHPSAPSQTPAAQTPVAQVLSPASGRPAVAPAEHGKI